MAEYIHNTCDTTVTRGSMAFEFFLPKEIFRALGCPTSVLNHGPMIHGGKGSTCSARVYAEQFGCAHAYTICRYDTMLVLLFCISEHVVYMRFPIEMPEHRYIHGICG